MSSQQSIHEQVKARSYQNLETARKTACKGRYNSQNTRSKFTGYVREKMNGREPFDWQLDVGEALHLGLDTMLIARTGAGKTLPFIAPAILGGGEGKILVISLLIALQNDQARSFEKLGIKAIVVNGETWSDEIAKVCTKSILSSNDFSKNIKAIIIDECHVVESWGAKFRSIYRDVGDLRAFVPMGVPILATTATLTPSSQQFIAGLLNINLDAAFYLNLGNDRPNIAYSVKRVSSPEDFDSLKEFFEKAYEKAEDIEQTLIYINERLSTQIACKRIRSWLPPALRHTVCFFHAGRHQRGKRRVLRAFQRGKYRVAVATEAAGMGTDIPNIARVIQLGVTDSLSTWLQRAGRAGRRPDMNAEAILLVEESIFQMVNIRSAAERDGNNTEESHRAPDSNEGAQLLTRTTEEVNEETHAATGKDSGESNSELVARKIVEPALRSWIETELCRRDKADEYFGNPPRTVGVSSTLIHLDLLLILTVAPTGSCCDNCTARRRREQAPDVVMASNSPSTIPVSARDTPGMTPNVNNKRPMVPSLSNALANNAPKKRTRNAIPENRSKDWLQEARDALVEWRRNLKLRQYPRSILSEEALLPDNVLSKLATKARLRSIVDIIEETGGNWALVDRHGDEVLAVLKAIDESRNTKKAELAAANREAAKQKRADDKAKRQQLEAEEQKKREAALQQQRDTQEKRVSDLQRRLEQETRDRDERQRRAYADLPIAQPLPRSTPLLGSTTFNQLHPTMTAPMFRIPQVSQLRYSREFSYISRDFLMLNNLH
ncbi:P-loop containing nucleoside triphosphate hydrolase protein [Schizopora paradoxa]|uniref:DNA 3'-5' helicase n=1 Tax=Schizopora paradoxa TaxID=27342 RepID=A0A0H2R4V3_9AGAM|nr:P-loop containing nucleoside triphosphate hydrolase protein [Schizopora paradoxa]